MAAEVESMFSTRVKPWHGLGKIVQDAPTSEEAIRLAGLDWEVAQEEMFTANGVKVPDAYANVRTSDNSVLGVVGNRYEIVQNSEAFSFTDALLGEGVRYETAGSLKDGKVIWLLAKLPEEYKILGDPVETYLTFTNSFDGSGAIKVAVSGVRVVCANTLNACLKQAKRTWSARHTGSINSKMEQARETLQFATTYMETLNTQMEEAYKVKLDDDKLGKMIDNLIPIPEDVTERKKNNLKDIRMDILFRYAEAPDLKDREQTGARFIQAVADTTSHMAPKRLTQNYQQNFFGRMIDGNDLLDRAVELVRVAA